MYTGVQKLRVKGQNLLRTQHPWPWHQSQEESESEQKPGTQESLMSSIKNSWTQGRSKESHPPALCSPSFLQNSPPWLPAPNGIKHFYCRVSSHFSSPGLGYRDSPSPPPRRLRRAPAERPGLAQTWGSDQGCDWLAGPSPGSWLAAGNTGLIRLLLAWLPALTSQNHLVTQTF